MRRARLGALKFPLAILTVWIAVLAVRLMPIGGAWMDLSPSTWINYLVWTLTYFPMLLLGISQPIGKPNARNWDCAGRQWKNGWVSGLSVISTIGAALIVYEFAVTRGYAFSTPIAVIRQMEVESASAGFAGSWISGAGRMLTPGLMIAWVLTIIGWSEICKRTLVVLSVATGVVFYQQVMFEGGRFYLAALFLMAFIARVFIARRNDKGRFWAVKRIFWLVTWAIICWFFGYVFIERYEQVDLAFVKAYVIWAANFDLEVDDEVLDRLSGDGSSVWLAVSMLWAYVTQGANELNALLTASQPDLALGSFQFPQLAQVLSKLTGFEFKYDQVLNLPKTGTYNTLYGASYIDFGHVGALIFIGCMAWLTGRSIRLLHSGHLNGLAINAPLLITIGVFSPIVSLVINLWPAFCWAFLVGSTARRRTAFRPVLKPTIN